MTFHRTAFYAAFTIMMISFALPAYAGAGKVSLAVCGDPHEWKDGAAFSKVLATAKSINGPLVIPGDLLTHRYGKQEFNPSGMPDISSSRSSFDEARIHHPLAQHSDVQVVIVPGNHDSTCGISNFASIVKGKKGKELKNVHILDYFSAGHNSFSASWSWTHNNVTVLFVGLGAWQDIYKKDHSDGADDASRNILGNKDKLKDFIKYLGDERRKTGADFVVVVTHQSFESDISLSQALAATGKAAHLIIGGHDHSITTFSWNGSSFSVKHVPWGNTRKDWRWKDASTKNLPVPIVKTGLHFQKDAFIIDLESTGQYKKVTIRQH